VILRVPDQDAYGLERWGGDLPGTTRALPADIIERAEKLPWMVRAGGKGDQRWKRGKPPRDFCGDYLIQRRGRYGARPLLGAARVPCIKDDGTIDNQLGYDSQTRIFHDRVPSLTIPESPSLEDAKRAAKNLLHPFQHYKLEDEATGSVLVLGAIFTALQRPFMATAPMFVINGAQAGTGKGQLVRAIGRLILDTTPPFMAWGHDDDEFKKRFDAMLMASPAMLVIDNANGRLLRGDTLEMILSEGTATLRPLGRSEAITVRNRTFLMANGNNISVSGDMTRRAFVISILPRSASPERERFPFTPDDYVMQHRDALLTEAYTIMRAWRLAGMPQSGLSAVGSFPEWEHKVRDLLFWLTGYDLTEEFEKNKKDDPHRQNDAALLAALYTHFGANWFKAAEVEAALKAAATRRREGTCHSSPVFTSVPTPAALVARMAAEEAVLEAAEQVFGSRPVNAKTLGHWARGLENAFVDVFVLRRQFDSHNKTNFLKVERQ
jgi:putative DNA primase/helicase